MHVTWPVWVWHHIKHILAQFKHTNPYYKMFIAIYLPNWGGFYIYILQFVGYLLGFQHSGESSDSKNYWKVYVLIFWQWLQQNISCINLLYKVRGLWDHMFKLSKWQRSIIIQVSLFKYLRKEYYGILIKHQNKNLILVCLKTESKTKRIQRNLYFKTTVTGDHLSYKTTFVGPCGRLKTKVSL